MKTKPLLAIAVLWLATCALLVGGLFVFVKIANSRIRAPVASDGPTLVFREGRQHPVTQEMESAARELGGAMAPNFNAVSLEGKPYTLASLTSTKPLVLFFVELQCPCCKGAKPYIDRIQTYYGDVCNVIGVIDAKPEMARLWSQTVGPQFDVVPDPEMSIIRSYKAERGVYTTLVAPGGRIVTAYPGYSQDMLRDITKKIARLAGVKSRPMPLEPAPKKLTSGCIFPGTKLPDDQL